MKIFISHSSKDKDLVDKFVDLLSTGIGINPHDGLVTSLEGLGIPPGEDFIDFLKEEVKDSKVIIFLITENFLDSKFCLCELGASWGLGKEIIPIIVPPINLEDALNNVLKTTQVIAIDDKASLTDMRERLIKLIEIEKPVPTSRWERKRDEFLNNLSDILESLPKSPTVSKEKYERLKEEVEELNELLDEKEEEIKRLENLIEKIKQAKDKEEVEKLEFESLPEKEQFDKLIHDLQDKLKELPSIVRKAIFDYYNGKDFYYDPREHRYLSTEIDDAVEKKYLLFKGDGFFEINLEKLKIERAIDSLEQLSNFLHWCSADFCKWFKKEYGFNPDTTDREFWEKFDLL